MACVSEAQAVHVVVSEEDGIWVAQCLEFDVASQGDTREEAICMFREAAALYIEELGHLPEWTTVKASVH